MESPKKYYTPYLADIELLKDEQSIGAYMAKVKKSPPSILSLMTDEKTADFLEDVLGPAFGLSETAIEDITRILRDTLLGDMFAGDLTKNIAEKLNIDQPLAQQIKDKIVKELLAPAIDDIKKIQRDKFPEETKQGSDTTPLKPPMPPQMANGSPVNEGNVINLRQDPNP